MSHLGQIIITYKALLTGDNLPERVAVQTVVLQTLLDAAAATTAKPVDVTAVRELDLLNEAKELAFTAIKRMRAAHCPCLDLTIQAEILVGNINAAIRALSPAEPVEQWQDIATAPKDGTVIDLWSEEFGRQADCYWGMPSHCCGEAGQYCDDEWHSEPEKWICSATNSAWFDDATHWMPLPAAPPTEAGQ